MKERIKTTAKLIVNTKVDLDFSQSTLIFTINFNVVLLFLDMAKKTSTLIYTIILNDYVNNLSIFAQFDVN